MLHNDEEMPSLTLNHVGQRKNQPIINHTRKGDYQGVSHVRFPPSN